MELNGPEFFQNWKQITAGPPLELQSVVKAPSPIDMNSLNKMIASVFRLTVLKGVDPNVNNLVAAGILHTSNGQQVTSLLRIETNPTAQMYRVTLRTTNAQVSSGFKDALVSQLS
jgi:AP-2 complex subunit alpha